MMFLIFFIQAAFASATPQDIPLPLNSAQYHVVFFWSPHCGCIGRQKQFIYDLQSKFAKEPVQFIFVDVGSPDQKTTEKMGRLFKFQGTFVNDRDKKITRAFGAQVTPEVFVLDHKRQILYSSAFVKEDFKSPKDSDPLLEKALTQILQKKTVTQNKVSAEGCYIEPGKLSL